MFPRLRCISRCRAILRWWWISGRGRGKSIGSEGPAFGTAKESSGRRRAGVSETTCWATFEATWRVGGARRDRQFHGE